MKFNKIVLMTVVASSPAFAQADDKVNYKFVGNSLAVQVCRAVVNDDVERLGVVLRSYRRSLVRSYSSGVIEAISKDFTCNDMELYEFSYTVGAEKVSSYFADHFAAGEGLVAGTNN